MLDLTELEIRIRALCDRSVHEIENKPSMSKETVQMLESINKMLSVFYERDKTRTVKREHEDKSLNELENMLFEGEDEVE